ncbi:restriction endonuclease [Kitasatospora aureofaciens]|uniref:restriction endonuclease n=1 Tax=Kitasatospora aureofaciens TaxID=1894 RepID=UPI000525CC28|nr:restriction endonuclease [Kitasatospora aureofaciens]
MTNQSSRTQQIHPAAFSALYEALSVIFFYKKELKKFLQTRAAKHPELVAGLDFDGYKRAFAEEFVDRLQEGGAKYRDLALNIMLEVAQMDSFPSLKWHEDAATLLPKAQEAVAALRTWTERQQGLIEERDRIAAELAAHRANAQARQGFATKLAALNDRFAELGKMEDRKKAGLLFEPFLNELFHLFDLEPRLSYVLETEQIDGSLSFDTDDYIVEAKWWKKAMEREHVDIFDAKVRRKGKLALGLYIAVNGFTAGALKEYDRRTTFITMDGGDLMCVLEGRIPLDELLRRKKRHANETGNCYFPAYLALAG